MQMYAVFGWFGVGIALSTLDWVLLVTYLVFIIEILRRIPQEEEILIELFHDEYHQYKARVGPLGCCLDLLCLIPSALIAAICPATQMEGQALLHDHVPDEAEDGP